MQDGDVATMCGPAGEDPPVYHDSGARPDRACLRRRAGAAQPRRSPAVALPARRRTHGPPQPGLLSTHKLRVGVLERDEWGDATDRVQDVVADDGRDPMRGQGYDLERLDGQSFVLKDGSTDPDSSVAGP